MTCHRLCDQETVLGLVGEGDDPLAQPFHPGSILRWDGEDGVGNLSPFAWISSTPTKCARAAPPRIRDVVW
jgi:hypothetical protein